MKSKFIISILCLVFFSSLASAVLISDQGTDVKNISSGETIIIANLSINIYDNETSGNLIFQQNFSDAILNGSWNLMINPDLEYGKIYWKDYKINLEDVDFDNNERLEFQSFVGKINNLTFINFSLIESCPVGSSIRLIYENGSIICEGDDSGSSNINLSNYALTNESVDFLGNITTNHSGFFSFLGSLTSRITKLFVDEINATGNINTIGNLSANYLFGDGSRLTNLPAGNEFDPIFLIDNSSIWSEINSKLIIDDQRYNETSLIISLNTTSNIISLGFYNKTEVDNLISEVDGGNSSFNQTLTDILYYPISNPFNLLNGTTGEIFNETPLITNINFSLWNYINLNENSWLSTYNSTYNSYNSTGLIINWSQFINLVDTDTWNTSQEIWNVVDNGTFIKAETDPKWSENYTNLVGTDCTAGALVIGVQNNGTILCATDSGATYTNGSGISLEGTKINHSDTSSVSNLDNSGNTFIQDLTFDTFGHVVTSSTGVVDFSNYVLAADIVSLVGNWTLDKQNYYTKTNIDLFDYYNLSDFNISNYYLKNNPFGFFNSTNPQTEIDSKAYNGTLAYNYSLSNYYPLNNPYGYLNSSLETDPLWSGNFSLYNSSWSSTYNSTYNIWTYNQTTPAINYVDSQGFLTSVENYSVIIKYQNISNIPTCTGTQKLTFNGTVLSCANDQTGSGGGNEYLFFSSGPSNSLTTDNFWIGQGESSTLNNKVGFLIPAAITAIEIRCRIDENGIGDQAGFTLEDDGVDTSIACVTEVAGTNCSSAGSASIGQNSILQIDFEEVAGSTTGSAFCTLTYTID